MAWACAGTSAVHAQISASTPAGDDRSLLLRDPIDLAANEIRVWDEGDARWYYLSGRDGVAVIQGDRGLRARQAIVRVRDPDAPGSQGYLAEVYAEEDAAPIGAPVKPARSLQMTLRSNRDIRVKPYDPRGVVQLRVPPRSALPILRRGFGQPRGTAAVAANATASPTSARAQNAPGGPAVAGLPAAATAPGDAPPPSVVVLPLPEPSPAGVAPASTSAPAAIVTPPPAASPPPGTSSPVGTARSSFPAPQSRPAAAATPRQVAPTSSTPSAPSTGTVATADAPPVATLSPIALPTLPGNTPDPPLTGQASGSGTAAVAGAGVSPRASTPVDAPGTVTRAVGTGVAGGTTSAGASVTPTQFAAEPAPGGGANAPAGNDNDVEELPPPVEALGANPSGAGAMPGDAAPVPLPSPPSPPSTLDGAPVIPNLEPPADGPADPRDEDTEAPPAPAPGPGTNLEPLPGPDGRPMPPRNVEAVPPVDPKVPYDPLPISAGTQRFTRIYPRNGAGAKIERLPTTDGTTIIVIRGGVQIISEAKQYGIVDVSADSAIIWRKGEPLTGPDGAEIQKAGDPLEVYMEGNVDFRQDQRKFAGPSDQKTFRAKQAYFDFRTERFVALEGEADVWGPGMIAPARIFAPRIDQYRRVKPAPGGGYMLGREVIRADKTVTTGSRFPNPGYTFTSRTLDMKKVVSTKTQPNIGSQVTKPGPKPGTKEPVEDLTWRIDARQNVYWLGWFPAFYWPRFVGNADDLEPPIRSFMFATNNYFGQQFLTDFNAFRLLSIERPKWIDSWNFDVDELTRRGLALGTEAGWFGNDFLGDLSDPYRRNRPRAPGSPPPEPGGSYFGYFDAWGLQDHGTDNLGPGPAVITNDNEASSRGVLQRSNVPAFVPWRGKLTMRHMQSLLTPDAEQDEDFRLQVEVGYTSDRNFLEEYYQQIFNTGLDQETLAYLIRQQQNTAWSVWTEVNPASWYTETQWLPRVDYYRLGDSLWNNTFTYFQHTGADYANTHTAAEVNNPFLGFAYMPYDPISNTFKTFSAGRFYTNHELDLPLQFDFLRLIPYVQGQAVGWTNQIGGESVGRVWGGAGARASVMAWKAFPKVESDIFNVHGLNHKINFDVDFRDAWSNVGLNQIGVQDDLDDNTYEYVRRYFALTNYAGGLLPPQYDPRFLILRRALSPISGPTDIQASIETLQMSIHQRLQTKRGPIGNRRVIDYMTLDLSTTYFPDAVRDNFGKPFGQNMYNWQWFIGDRTSIISYGWFEFWKIGGLPIFNTNVARNNNPFGLNVVTSGISINRPPRGQAFLGYTVINTGPINTSAVTASLSYWLSPKWYAAFSEMYDFGNQVPLGSMVSFTRIGADYLVTIGLTVDPQRNSYNAAFMISPRMSPNIHLGSGLGMTQFDSRYAPTQ